MVLTTRSYDPKLDLAASVGQRQATFRFDLIDAITGQVLQQVNPLRDQPPILTHDTGRAVKRSIDQILLNRADTSVIDPIGHRIAVYMLIGGTAWPLGRYMFSAALDFTNTAGAISNDALVDEMFIVDQQRSTAFTPGGTVEAAVLALLDGQPIIGIDLETSPYSAVGSWPAGTRGGTILDALATLGDYFTPWMGHDGRFKMIRTVDPAAAVPGFDLDISGRVIRDSISHTSDVLNAPNRFVVISNAGAAAASGIVGTYDVPPTAPHSLANRGFLIPDVRTLQISSAAQASAAAQNLGIRQTIYERVDLSTVPDPRHDSYDVIRWQGNNWLELAWSLPLIEGAAMRHTMRKAYS